MADEVKVDAEMITAVYRSMGRRRWADKTDTEKRAHALHMVACRRRKSKLRAKRKASVQG